MPRGVYDRSEVKKDKPVEGSVPKKRGRPPGKLKETKEKDPTLPSFVKEVSKPSKAKQSKKSTEEIKKYAEKIFKSADLEEAGFAVSTVKSAETSYNTNPIYLSSQVRENLYTLNALYAAFNGGLGGKSVNLTESIIAEISKQVATLGHLNNQVFGGSVELPLPVTFVENKPVGSVNSEHKTIPLPVPTVPSIPVSH